MENLVKFPVFFFIKINSHSTHSQYNKRRHDDDDEQTNTEFCVHVHGTLREKKWDVCLVRCAESKVYEKDNRHKQ